ncbi:MAG: hypothetical protein ABGY75_10280 [Gemmataceae bacterium]
MARGRNTPDFSAAWAAARGQFAAGEVRFVDTLREIADPDGLGEFAREWYADPRPDARGLLHVYLSRPLNALRHEPLVKRLFKLAEAARDDETMAHFLVALDRTVRKKTKIKKRYTFENTRGWGREVRVVEEEVTVDALKEIPRVDWVVQGLLHPHYGPWQRDRLDLPNRRLFSGKTRTYLRRRAWRYFRTLGRQFPQRYVSAVSTALKQYTDEDTADGLGLLSNWGLAHILFHFSPAIVSKPSGWVLAPGKTVRDLTAEPYHNALWRRQPDAALGLITSAKARTVRQWAMRWLAKESPQTLEQLPLDTLLDWLKAKDADMAAFAVARLRAKTGLEGVPLERWMGILDSAPADALDVVCDLIGRNVRGEQLSLFEAVRFAKMRATPVARLGLRWLEGKVPTSPPQIEAVLSVRDALAQPLRPELCRWAAKTLSDVPNFKPEWVMEFLDSRHEDVRTVGLEWLESDQRAKDAPAVWQRMLESPYDNIRLPMAEKLAEITTAGADEDICRPELVRLLWATVLLNIHRGGRQKALVVRQICDRLSRKPEESKHLLPILAVAVRSTRGIEFRTGLTAVVRLQDTKPELGEAIGRAFPELRREQLV